MKNKNTVLIHICCAPCLTYTYEYLKEKFPGYKLTGYFYNPNIYPVEEYNKRFDALVNYSKITGIEVYSGDYDFHSWEKAAQNYKDEPEGGKRCEICFRYRLKNVFEHAEAFGIPIITSTLSISPHKNTEMINRIGIEIADKYPGITFLTENYKKNDGFKKSINLSKKYNPYRQTYCGCSYSLK